MAQDKLSIVVALKDRFSKGMKSLGGSLGGVKKGVEALKSAVFGLKGALVGVAAIFAGKQLIDIANEQSKAVIGMETALRSMGRYTPEFSQKMQDIASNIQSFTNFGDEAVLMGQKFLATYVNITDDLLPRVSRAMVDLSALMGGDMTRAANMMGKASMGMIGQLSLAGISVDKTTYKMRGFVGVLEAIENQSRGQARAQREATGSMIAMGNSFGDLKEKVGDFLKIISEPVFKILLEQFDKLNDKIVRLKKEGKFKEWAIEVSKGVTTSFFTMAKGIAAAYDSIEPTLREFKSFFKDLDSWAEEWADSFSQLGTILRKSVYLKETEEEIKAITDQIKLLEDEVSKTDWWLNFWKGPGYHEELPAKLDILRKKLEDLTKVPIETIINTKELARNIGTAEAAVISFEKKYLSKLHADTSNDKPSKGTKEDVVPKIAAPVVAVDLTAEVNKQLLSLEILYQRGEEELIAYLERRKALVLLSLGAEMGKLEEAAKAEDDVTKRLELEDQLFTKKQQYALKEIELTKQIASAQEDLTNKKIELDDILTDLKTRATTGGSGELENLQAEEMAELDRRQQEEMQRIMELTEFMESEEEKRATIKQAYRNQDIEKEKVLAQQKQALMIQRLDTAQNIAGGVADILQDMYELGGKKSKEMFELQKKAAIAEAIISTAKAVAGALGTPPYGLAAIASASIIALKGGLQIAKIKAQEMAEGGLVRGYSPNSKADNIPVKGTAGEFMQPVSAVKHLGVKVMEGIRNNLFPRELFEGFSLPTLAHSPAGSGYAEGGLVTNKGGDSNFSVSVPVNIGESQASGISGVLQEEIEQTVIKVMERELR